MKKATIDGSDNLRWLPGVTFQISGTSDYGNDIQMLLTSDESGAVSIQNLELGSYEMTEVAVPDGIILSQTVYTVRCNSSGILSISYTDSEGQEVSIAQDKSGDYVIVNEPTHSFTLWKMDPLDNSSLSGAIFTLTGTSDYETPVDMEVTSDDNGMVKFDGLEPGSYVLKETVAPANHLLDETPRMVTVDSKGTVTIDGLTQDETYHWFPVENERSNEGVITITKQWEGDDGKESDRPIPVIHLDTEAPTHSLPVATISRNLWQNNACAGAYASYRGLEYATSFTHNTDATKEEVTASGSGWKKIDDGKTEYSIYFKYDSVAKQAYWWSDASIVYFPADSSGMFFNCTNLTSLDLRDFDTSKVTNMGYMFQDCNKLTNLDLSSFNTSQVNNMEYMFYKCNSLTSLNLSSFNTSKVSSMRSMFRLCSSLTSLNVSSFNTSQVYNMEYMFAYCKNLTSLNLSSFNTSRVIDMSYMFDNCQKLESLDLSNFDTSRCEYMVRMFECCYALTSLDVSSFDTSRVATMEYMFYDCEKLTSLDLSNWNTSQVINMGFIFCSCNSLKTIYASELWDMTKLTSYSSDNMMFYGCYVLVGGNGTTYDGNYTRGTYARIDKPGEPGYFTEKPAPSTPTPASHSAPTFSTPTPAKTAGENVAINQTSNSEMYEGDPAESANAYNQWVKNDDGTWTYRFNVYDGDATYYIWEEALPGYISDTDAEHPVEVTYTAGGTLASEDDRLVDDPVTDEGGTVHHNYAVKITNTKDD
ncbi:MAG: BspA family leucine-rich repeat surface protein, partial [Oscillospiraceae bacterium]|nr:BspA family leucine-rich repeat surface protein [Oscillospiraceae bacterium]